MLVRLLPLVCAAGRGLLQSGDPDVRDGAAPQLLPLLLPLLRESEAFQVPLRATGLHAQPEALRARVLAKDAPENTNFDRFAQRESEIEFLQDKLRRALQAEDYATATEVRDRIKTLGGRPIANERENTDPVDPRAPKFRDLDPKRDLAVIRASIEQLEDPNAGADPEYKDMEFTNEWREREKFQEILDGPDAVMDDENSTRDK
jgi:hypothetical protein